MIDPRREEQASLYVLGALPPEEFAEFQQALAGNLELQLLVRDLQPVAEELPLGVPAAPAPGTLKQALLTRLDRRSVPSIGQSPEPHRQPSLPWLPWAIAASFATLCLLLLGLGRSLHEKNAQLVDRLSESEQAFAGLQAQQTNLQTRVRQMETNHTGRVNDLQRQLSQRTQDLQKQKAELENRIEDRANQLAQAQKQITVLRNQATVDTSELERLNDLFGSTLPSTASLGQLRLDVLNPTPEGPPNASGVTAWDSPVQKGLLVVENLAQLPANLDYQLWVFDANQRAPISGGTFRVSERGASRIEFKTAVQVSAPDRFAVSIERRGGTAVPQGRFILSSN